MSTAKIVFEGEHWKSTMIKNMLEENNIPAFLQDEYIGSIAPFQTTLAGVNPVKVVVSSEFYEAAKALIQDFET